MRNFVGFFFLKWPLHLVETLRERDFSFAVLLDGPLQTADDVTKSHNRETQTKGTDDEIIIFSSRERKRERGKCNKRQNVLDRCGKLCFCASPSIFFSQSIDSLALLRYQLSLFKQLAHLATHLTSFLPTEVVTDAQ